MAEGFKKYFNGTTINGRANVAKATYATLALLYIFYRLRRGSGKESQLASETCSCDAETETMPHGDTGIYGSSDPDCPVCRDRSERAMSEHDREQQRKAAAEDNNGCRDDPPPPPPSNGGAGGSGRPRAKCPCEDSQKRVNGALKNSNSHSSHIRAWSHQLQPPNQYQQHFQQHVVTAPTDQGGPVSELMRQVQDAVSRVMRGVVDAVTGGAASSSVNTTTGGSTSSSSSSSVGEAQSSSQSSYYGQDEDEEEDEEEDGWDEGRVYDTRKNPLFCTPTSNASGTAKPQEDAFEDNYNAFSDGFASDMFFTSDSR
ncbi:uncharacterized protein [Drosophila kikkawai]|uniref:Uncharacterized protein n=1 Tax=Drosophila kikkawai TaxID=30033 RepID=A0A6P4J0M3_DROKI|nr:uncharacterized protein LOC108079223 [Drosophila kikkawai]